MSIIVFDSLEQGTEEWFQARMGMPTASEFQCLLAKGRGGGESKGRKTYLYKLAGERISGKPMEHYSNGYLERGHAMEDEARALYELTAECDVKRVGFVRNDLFRAGASPDGFVGDDGLIEIKTKAPHLQLELLESGELPGEHRAQCQGAMWVSGRQWVDFVSYFTGMPPFILRVDRDERYIAELAVAVKEFNEELDALVARYKQ